MIRLEIHGPDSVKASEECRLRVLMFNESYEPISVSRRALVGPNLSNHRPEAVEPNSGEVEEPLVLQPFTFYGRERAYDNLTSGEVEVTAYYRRDDGQVELVAVKNVSVLPA